VSENDAVAAMFSASNANGMLARSVPLVAHEGAKSDHAHCTNIQLFPVSNNRDVLLLQAPTPIQL
jgi:hypothetical protein